MHTEESTLIDAHLKGVSLRLLWGMIICTVVACTTILGVYYNFREAIAIQNEQVRSEIKMINFRLDKLEKK